MDGSQTLKQRRKVVGTSSKLTLNRSLELKINDVGDFLAIRSLDSLSNYLIINTTSTILNTNLNMNANEITSIGRLSYALGDGNELDDNVETIASDAVITALQSKTQNITASSTQTTFTKNNTL